MDNTELNKIKVVLCALWDERHHLNKDAEKIVKGFKEEIDEIVGGN